MDSEIKKVSQLNKEQREEFYQAQYDYYKAFNRGVMIISVVAYLSFFITDCGIFGRFAQETVFSRLIAILPLILFMYLYKKNKNYKIMVVF